VQSLWDFPPTPDAFRQIDSHTLTSPLWKNPILAFPHRRKFAVFGLSQRNHRH
jgi:hypothetical protein